MLLISGGALVFAATSFIFWKCMPRDGKLHGFANTEWEPYIGVAFTSGFALSFTMLLSGVIGFLG